MYLIIIRAGSGKIAVHFGWKTTLVCEKGKIFVDGTVPVCRN